eukprot:9906581-Ditylum_brightwellii.AAC.1
MGTLALTMLVTGFSVSSAAVRCTGEDKWWKATYLHQSCLGSNEEIGDARYVWVLWDMVIADIIDNRSLGGWGSVESSWLGSRG